MPLIEPTDISALCAGEGSGIEIEIKSHQNAKPENVLVRIKNIHMEYY